MKNGECFWLLLKGPLEAQLELGTPGRLYFLTSAQNVLRNAFDLIRE
jgi:hypothetical protein